MSIKVAIIGSGPGGMAAALYLKRSGINPILLEKNAPGGQVLNTFMVENYLGFEKISGADLALKMFEQIQKAQILYKSFDLKRIEKKDKKFILFSENEAIECDKIIIATGKSRKKLNLPNNNIKGISYCAVCDGMFYKNEDVAVLGGSDSALTEALYLSQICQTIYLIVREEIKAKQNLIDKVKQTSNIEIIKGRKIDKINGEDYLTSVILDDNTKLEIKGLFVAIGGIPNNDFLDQLNIDLNKGYIKTNENMMTREKNIYAIGDIRDKKYMQIISAVNDGMVAALSIVEGD